MKTALVVPPLTPHPRLYLGVAERRRLKGPFRSPLLRATAKEVTRLADEYLEGPQFDWVRNTHNAHLVRARRMQGRVVTLLVRWSQTGDMRYRDAARDHLLEMGRWECWSWIAWRDNQFEPDAIFDLSYGENSATLAIGYDWLYDTLDAAERQALLDVMRRPVAAFLKHTAPESRAWWFGKRDSNWNTVCAGGAGMLALACFEELPEAALILERACECVEPFVAEIRAVHGAWPEGIGYWNYGMRYLYMFVLSLEQATGRRSPWLDGRAVRDALMFPMYFTPYPGCACSFGDVNQWSPLPFHLAAARRLRQPVALAELVRHLQPPKPGTPHVWPNAAELLCLYDDAPNAPTPQPGPFVHHYKGLDWVVLADRMPAPRLYASVRGGTTEVPHGHVDLTSFHAVVGDEKMIASIGPANYLDTTFSARRWELFEMVPMSKNVLLVDGVGIVRPSTVATRTLNTSWGPAVRLDAATALGDKRRGNDGVVSYYRLFLLLPGTGLLVLDTIQRPHASLFEQRFFTPVHAQPLTDGFLLEGVRQTAMLTCACSEPTTLHTADAPLTQPSDKPPTMLRHITKLLHEEVSMAALLTPGKRPVPLALRRGPRGIIEVVIGRGDRLVLRFSRNLLPRP